MKWYCLVNEIKPEHRQDYIDIHKNAHKTHWRTQLDALKEAGAENCLVFMFGNYAILFYQCEEINESFEKLGAIEANNRWQEHIASWFAGKPKFDGTEPVKGLEKIFDLNEQLDGRLEQ
jgi:L-rhamnose mutarotase